MITFRQGPLQLALPAFLGILGGTALVYAGLALTADPMPLSEVKVCVSAAVVAAAGIALLNRHHGVSLTEEALVMRGNRRRRIPWTDIVQVEVRRTLGVRQVVVHTRDGRATVLRAPMSFVDGQFDRKVAVLREWWEARHGLV
ncbi:hypothetical protein [Streptomyces sp. NBC_00038]|uniref:hypothetical protein n=1 Tax=Streptomyces sp. NBC_00038 TaxID=2903615 RepID=UPI0022581EA3|nr:hypothetical protein [Streptomyces sp. NBC_00038]MCX5560656.1 hypothetical protein [Streptomyces sp. NBC_00038]